MGGSNLQLLLQLQWFVACTGAVRDAEHQDMPLSCEHLLTLFILEDRVAEGVDHEVAVLRDFLVGRCRELVHLRRLCGVVRCKTQADMV